MKNEKVFTFSNFDVKLLYFFEIYIESMPLVSAFSFLYKNLLLNILLFLMSKT